MRLHGLCLALFFKWVLGSFLTFLESLAFIVVNRLDKNFFITLKHEQISEYLNKPFVKMRTWKTPCKRCIYAVKLPPRHEKTDFGNYFNNQIQSIQNSPLRLNFIGALIAYVFLSFGLNFFIIQRRESWFHAFLLGIVIYGVYEGTNYAIYEC